MSFNVANYIQFLLGEYGDYELYFSLDEFNGAICISVLTDPDDSESLIDYLDTGLAEGSDPTEAQELLNKITVTWQAVRAADPELVQQA